MQNRAFKNLFVGPNKIEDVALSVGRIERGDVKLRVRALDAERALNRVMVSYISLFLHGCTASFNSVIKLRTEHLDCCLSLPADLICLREVFPSV